MVFGRRLARTGIRILLLVSFSAPISAEQQMSREDYVAQSHEDLLAPCRSPGFASCLGTSEQECLDRVNRLVEDCSQKLPATITEKNFDASADDYASCVFDGLQKSFDMSSEEIGQCENRAGLR